MSKILDKVKKLRNLANDKACTPEEAANYAAMLQDLLFKHNLNDADLIDAEHVPVYEKETINLGVSSPATKGWRQKLFGTLARFNFCKIVILPGNYIYLIGQEENREFVKFLYGEIEQYLQKSQKLALKSFTASLPFGIDAKGKALWTKSFYLGANNTIHERLESQKKTNIEEANQANTGSGTALAIKVDNALRDAVSALVGATKQTKSRGQRVNSNGYSSGVQAGNNASLNRSFTNRVALGA
jgi:hypothetical protein